MRNKHDGFSPCKAKIPSLTLGIDERKTSAQKEKPEPKISSNGNAGNELGSETIKDKK